MAAATSRADTTWEGDLMSGKGTVRPKSGAFPPLAVSWARRTEPAAGATSPEELLAAAHSSCYSMQFSNMLAKAGHPPTRLETSADVDFVAGQGITEIRLAVRGSVPGIDQAQFEELANSAKDGCPVSKALAGNVKMSVKASLEG